ncbi:hypothetical protein P3T76_010541 [Phytophthora citrophthora]|uniref:Uncharacterized protein n=1 Tax=Phytophthora citrophthora TaxID=4793 RepID=A0AAD9GCG4_9STRA|nr:hypothetical protein P3T76_010541 [Phytophthora citrophthora]
MASEIQDLKAHYQDQVEALKADKATLKSQVADLQAQVSILKSRPDVKPTDPWGFSGFLQENSEFSGNWDRLHDLLVSYQEDTIVPDHWTTIINVTALNERKKPDKLLRRLRSPPEVWISLILMLVSPIQSPRVPGTSRIPRRFLP